MMPSSSLPVAESSACSVMDTTRIPFRRSMDLKTTACSRLRVKRLNFQTNISLKGASGLAASSSILRNCGPIGYSSALGLVDILAGDVVAVLLCVVPERPQLGGHGQVYVLPFAGHPGVKGRRYGVLVSHSLILLFRAPLCPGDSLNRTAGIFHGSPNNFDNLVQKCLRGRVHDGAD